MKKNLEIKMKNTKELIEKINEKQNIDGKFVLDKTGTIMLEYVILLSDQVKETNSIPKKLDLIAEQNTYLAAITALAYVK